LENTSVAKAKALEQLTKILKLPTNTIHKKYNQLNKSINKNYILKNKTTLKTSAYASMQSLKAKSNLLKH
jgi:hypothetical protein